MDDHTAPHNAPEEPTKASDGAERITQSILDDIDAIGQIMLTGWMPPLTVRLPRPCLDCGVLTEPGKSRCAAHQRIARKGWVGNTVANRRARMATGDGAAARLRAKVKREGGAVCASCGEFYPAPLIEIDHPVRLGDGGQDIDSNVVPMDRRCHSAKTARENRADNQT